MFADRRRRAGRFLEWKVGLFCVAAVLTIAGMYLEARWMTGLAIVVLASAMLLRFLPGGRKVDEFGDDDDWQDDEHQEGQ
ncbi:MAG: hypothetical protein HKN72_17425 [Gemmatimonadetes bacterium]|nr:hypothetical protein [Gemmatimonadota bacterium]NNF15011.1 hypothetical protein [Gemmatimonadota bacterium]